MNSISPRKRQAFSNLISDTSSWGERIKTEADEKKAIQAVHAALKLGINYIDTSPLAGEGRVESLLGKVNMFFKTPKKQSDFL